MKQIVHIIKYKIITFLKLNPIHNFGDFFKSFGSFVVYSGFAFGTYVFTKIIINYLLVQAKIGLFLLHEFLSIVFFIFFLSINIGNIIVLFSTLYKSDEIGFLLAKPVTPVKIFTIKFLDNFFYSSSTLLLIILTAFLGYGIYFHINILSILSLIVFNLFPMMLSAASIGVIILLLLMKLSTKINFKLIIYSLIFLYLALLISFFKLSSPVTLVNKVMEYYPNIDQYFDKLIPAVYRLLPNHWLSESLYWIVLNQPEKALPYYTFQIITIFILLLIAITLGNKWYYSTWLNSVYLKNQKNIKNEFSSSIFDFNRSSFFPSQTEVIIKKELKLFFREPSQVIHLSLLLALISIFIFSLKGLTLLGSKIAEFQTIIYLSVFVFNVLFISTLSLRFVFPIVSLEGESFWKIRTSPLNAMHTVKIKLIIYFIPIFIIAQVLSYFANRKFSDALILHSGIITTFACIALVLLNFGMGAIFANYKEKNPIRVSSSQGAAISFLLNIVFMVFLVIILAAPFNNFFKAAYHHLQSDFSQIIIASIIIGLTSLVISLVIYRFSTNYILRDF